MTKNKSSAEKKDPTHVDDWVDAFDTGKQSVGQKYARFCLFLYRLAAVFQMDWPEWIKKHKLFCTYEGKRFRMTGASRMGDVWITKDFDRDTGYDMRVLVDDCSDWSDNPGEYIGVLSLADEHFEDSAAKLQEIRKIKNMTVSVSAEELACLMYKAHDCSKRLGEICAETEWTQEAFTNRHSEPLLGFPEDAMVSSSHTAIMSRWIKNLLKITNNIVSLREDLFAQEDTRVIGFKINSCLRNAGPYNKDDENGS
jgi:hypothetical protein